MQPHKISDSLYTKLQIEEMLEEQLNLKCKEIIAPGKYGEILLFEKPSGERKAGKIVKTEKRDSKVWPCLEHENIVQLEKNIFMPDFKAHCFLMPLQYMTLENIVNSDWFQRDSDNIFDVKRWLLDTLSGVEYLHGKNICHLNIDPSNILISYDSKAKLSSFGLVTFSTQPVMWSGHGFPYYPPELCYSRGENVLVDPIGVDLWSLGMMSLRLFTKNLLHEELGNSLKPWSKDIYKKLFKVIKYLWSYIEEAYPELEMSPLDCKRLKNFILMFLSLQPETRPSAELAKNHRFLCSGLFMPKRDAVWKKKASSVVIEMIVEKHNTAELVRERCEKRKSSDSMQLPLKPHDQYQFIKLFASNKDEKNLINYAENMNKREDAGEKCSSAIVQKRVHFGQIEEFPGNHSLGKCHSIQEKSMAVHSEEKVTSTWDKLRMETPADQDDIKSPEDFKKSTSGFTDTIIQIEEVAGNHSPDKCQSVHGKSVAVHSEDKVISVWDKLRMETPADQDAIESPDDLKKSASEFIDTVIQKIPAMFDRVKPDGGEKEKKRGFISRTKAWFVKKFRSFRK